MKIDGNCPLDQTHYDKYNEFIEKITTLLDDTEIPNLCCVLLQAGYEVSKNKEIFATERINIFTGELLSKVLNEGWGIISCLEKGAYLTTYHHTRATLELTGIYYWVIDNKDEIDKRMEMYFEYKELLHYQLYLKYKDCRHKKLADQLNSISEDILKKYEGKTEYWKSLFNPRYNDILQVHNWHNPTSISRILRDFPVDTLKMLYEECSQATHFSPVSQIMGLEGSILGLPVSIDGDKREIDKHAVIYLESFEPLLSYIKAAIGFDSKVKFPRGKIELDDIKVLEKK